MYRRRGLKVNPGKRKMMVLGGEEGLECKNCLDGIRLEHVSEFKHLGCVLDKSGTDEAECSRKVANGRSVTGDIRSLVYARSLQLECARVFHESLMVTVVTYGSETMIWREKERSRIKGVQINNRRGLFGIMKMDKVPNARIRQLCRVTKSVDERIEEGVLRWLAMWREWRMTGLLRGTM